MILIVDDDAAIGDALTLLLELEGYQARVCSGSEVMLHIKQNKPDLVILDIWLSGKDGREVSRALKAGDDTHQIPILLISASRNLDQSAVYAQADDYIEKPFEMEAIVSKIRRLIE
jgi:DNA-binding response OmpR family regulator